MWSYTISSFICFQKWVSQTEKKFSLINDEDEVDDDIEEGLAENHQNNEDEADEAAEELGAEHGPTQLAAEYEWIPIKLIWNDSR